MVKRVAAVLVESARDCSRERGLLAGTSEAFTILEACEASRIGRTKIYQAIHEGRLIARKLGKKTLILRSDLREFLNALPSATDLVERRGGCARKDQTSD